MRISPVKIARNLRDIHQDCIELYTLLSEQVRELLWKMIEERGWFFLSRLKRLESFALKVETGRVPDPRNLEDFLPAPLSCPQYEKCRKRRTLSASVLRLIDEGHLSRRKLTNLLPVSCLMTYDST